ncbi:ATP-binding protein [Paraburkholderia sp. EG287B]|uniref:ATP-binding protein n=1 Tax=Paraburkholderia sp. EG287B TaxID=3237010 RepID=UPI0034D2B2F1
MSGPQSSFVLPLSTRAWRTLDTQELYSRQRRRPDYQAELDALSLLARSLGTSKVSMLQALVDTALKLCEGDSAGISLREFDNRGIPMLRWVALAGPHAKFTGHPVPISDSPGGVAIKLAAPQLFAFPKQQFDCLSVVAHEVAEELVVPISGVPKPWGAIWVMSGLGNHFDSEHLRILCSLASFACAALTMNQVKANDETRAEQAEAAASESADAEAEKDGFIALLAHELRNPLSPIEGALEVAQASAVDAPTRTKALELARRQVSQLKRLVADLLDASRVRHGKLSVRPADALLGDIVDDAMDSVRDEVSQRRHRVHLAMPGYPVPVYADAARLTQVISNLLSNAIKYTPPGGDIVVKVGAPDLNSLPAGDSETREARITIRDNGMGIAPDLLPRVFDLFSQSPSARTRAEGGLGLGLSVVKYLVNAHHGQIDISSRGEGSGTEVTVRLPIVRRGNAKLSPVATQVLSPLRILVVDDCRDSAEALSMRLALEGHEVKSACSGEEALSLLASFLPDAALIDLQMPGMDGRQLARLLRQQGQCASTHLIAVSGYTPTTAPEMTGGEFDAYLSKPLSPEDLANVLRR